MAVAVWSEAVSRLGGIKSLARVAASFGATEFALNGLIAGFGWSGCSLLHLILGSCSVCRIGDGAGSVPEL